MLYTYIGRSLFSGATAAASNTAQSEYIQSRTLNISLFQLCSDIICCPGCPLQQDNNTMPLSCAIVFTWYGRPFYIGRSLFFEAQHRRFPLGHKVSTCTVKTRIKTTSRQWATRYCGQFCLVPIDFPFGSNVLGTFLIRLTGQLLQAPLYLFLCNTTTSPWSWSQLYYLNFFIPSPVGGGGRNYILPIAARQQYTCVCLVRMHN